MSYSYKISGSINAYPIKDKYFRNARKAMKYLDKLATINNLQVEDVYVTDGIMTTFVVNNYSRFILTKLAY
ncbi:MAG: hypothetical protein K6F81_02145 [Acholeplasmatales bacterium]|nr:hypothetical protein [Acholeplasmatales bacterium]